MKKKWFIFLIGLLVLPVLAWATRIVINGIPYETFANLLITGDADVTGDLSVTGDIELGHPTDTTIARSGAGDATIEGKQLYRADGTDVADADMVDAHSHAADSIDAITEIAAALKSGSDAKVVTGTKGANTIVAVWNTDGDLVGGAGVPYVVGGTDVADADVVDDITVTSTKKISTILTTEQFRLGYNAANYLTATLESDGHTTIATVDSGGAEADINFVPNGNVGIKTAAPSVELEVTGSIKGTTLTDGTAVVTGGAITGSTMADQTISSAACIEKWAFFDGDGELNCADGLAADIDTTGDITTTGAVVGGTGVFGTLVSKVVLTIDTDAQVDLEDDSGNGETRVNDAADNDDIEYILPPAIAGDKRCFYDHSTDGKKISIDPDDGTDEIFLNGAGIGAGDMLHSSETRGDYVCLLAITADIWVTIEQNGTWVDTD